MKISIYKHPDHKTIEKLYKIDNSSEIESWQHDLVYSFNKNQQKLQEQLECSICYEILVKPMACPYCKNIFCEICLKKWFQMTNRCPTCRVYLGGEFIHIDRRLENIAEFVKVNWDYLAKRFENFYKNQKEIKIKELEEIDEFKNVIAANQINQCLFYRKYTKIKEKITIKENLPLYSQIIKNEGHYEKAVLAEAANFNDLLEAKVERGKKEQEYREVKEQLVYYRQSIEWFEKTKLNNKTIKKQQFEKWCFNAILVLIMSITAIVIHSVLDILV